MTQNISLIVLIEVQEGQREKQIAIYKKLAPVVLAEPGCLQYELKGIEGNNNQFALLETWESSEALSAHDVTPHMIEADALNPSFRTKPATVIKLSSIDG